MYIVCCRSDTVALLIVIYVVPFLSVKMTKFNRHIQSLKWISCVIMPENVMPSSSSSQLLDYIDSVRKFLRNRTNSRDYPCEDAFWHDQKVKKSKNNVNSYEYAWQWHPCHFDIYRTIILHMISVEDDDAYDALIINIMRSLRKYEYSVSSVIDIVNSLAARLSPSKCHKLMTLALQYYPPSDVRDAIVKLAGNNWLTSCGDRHLCAAVGNGMLEYVSSKMSNDIDINEITRTPYDMPSSLLQIAAYVGDVAMIRLLIERGADVNGVRINDVTKVFIIRENTVHCVLQCRRVNWKQSSCL